jgi:hypothetical protein
MLKLQYQMNPCNCSTLLADRDKTKLVICAYLKYANDCKAAELKLNESLDEIFKDFPPDKIESQKD